MSKVETSKLFSDALKYAVGVSLFGKERVRLVHNPRCVEFLYSDQWTVLCSLGKEASFIVHLIELEKLNIKNDGLTEKEWWVSYPEGCYTTSSPHLSVAVMRCVVLKHLGREVDIPLELVAFCAR